MLPRILAILALACCAGAFSPLISVPLSRISHAATLSSRIARSPVLRVAPLHQRRASVLQLKAAADVKPPAEALEKAKGALPNSKFVEYDVANIAQVLEKIWEHVVEIIPKKGEQRLLYFPETAVLGNNAVVNRLVGHMEICRDCCDDFGNVVTLTVVPTTPTTMPLFLLKNVQSAAFSGEDDDSWDDDDWGDDSDILAKYANLLGDDDGKDSKEEEEFKKLTDVPKDDEAVTNIIRDWVRVIISDMGVCPFSRDPDHAGLPAGPVHYPISRQTTVEEMYAEYWKEVNFLVSAPEKEFSTTLHIMPNFCISNVEAFTSWTNTLSAPLEALGIEKFIQLVFFHPQWLFRDGEDRMGERGAANFARRSPFPMVNILRTPQVRLAQRSIPTGLVYQQNEKTMMEVGADKLQEMLLARNWSALEDKKVDRRYNKLGKIAQMLMENDGEPPDEVRKALEEQVKALEAEGKGGAPPSAGAPPGKGPQGNIDFEQQTPDDQGMKF